MERIQSDPREEIKDITRKEIAERRHNLVQVKRCIEGKFQKSLSNIDHAYVESKYAQYCTRFWLQEATDFVKQLIKDKRRTVVEEIFSSLDAIQDLSSIPRPLNQLRYYKLLLEHRTLIAKADEENAIRQFKNVCIEQIATCSDSTQKEIELLEAFVSFLSSCCNLRSLIAELQLDKFCDGDVSFDVLSNNIMKLQVGAYGVSVTVLQNATLGLKEEEDLFLRDKVKAILGSYIVPVELRERVVDNRQVVEVIGRNVTVSEILRQLEEKLSASPGIEEIRFICADLVQIDADFRNEVWHGKNVVVVTEAIKIQGCVIWDVSGLDNSHAYYDDAGTGEDGDGKQGNDGYPGESGGNVLIIVGTIDKPDNLTIISNGGNGSSGQNGGKGKDGKEGVGIKKEDFEKKFPPVARFFKDTQREAIAKTLDNIKEKTQTIETEWVRNFFGTVYEDDVINRYKTTDIKQSIFLHVITNQGNEIIFSYQHSSFTANSQAFLIHKGTLGQPGGQGGAYGLGGLGGYAGEIIIRNFNGIVQQFNVKRETKQGQDGEKGKGGLYGRHGKNGWDMGYGDYMVSKFFTGQWPKFYGTNENSKCTIEYYCNDNDPSDRIWCPYKDKYAQICASKIENKKQKLYEERNNVRQNNNRQHHTKAVRKNNILQESIVNSYSHHFSSVAKITLHNLRTDLKNIQQLTVRAIAENKKQQKKHTTELRIRRHVSAVYQSKTKVQNYLTPTSVPFEDTGDVESFINALKSEPPTLLEHWLQLKGIELNRHQLNALYSYFDRTKRWFSEKQDQQHDSENIKLRDVEKLLFDKYEIATLREIAEQLPPYLEVSQNVQLTAESTVRYLVEGKRSNSNVSHYALGTLNQYFYEDSKDQREKISDFCKNELQTREREGLLNSMITFVLEVGNAEESHVDIKKFYNEYKEFLRTQEHSLGIFFEALRSELSQPRHADIYASWIESIKDNSLVKQLEEKIEKDQFLKLLYNRFNNQRRLQYDWDICCRDETVLEKFYAHILEKGASSESYRVLLTHTYDVNIRVYAVNEDMELFLQDNHNPDGRQIIHLLVKDSKFAQLNIDENFLKLEEERQKRDSLYARIFAEVKKFKQRQEFDHYLGNKAFLASETIPENYRQCSNEDEDIEKIVAHFPEMDRHQLKERLDKITSQYIGQQGILHHILRRFTSEGRRVSGQELHCFVNAILSSIIDDRTEQNIFGWIVAAHSQQNWIDELILLQLENCTRQRLAEKSKWRGYLSKIKNKYILLLLSVKLDQQKTTSSAFTQCFEDTLRLLSSIHNGTVKLEGLELTEWPYALKEQYWMCSLSKLMDWEGDDLSTASYYLLSVENYFGTDLVEQLVQLMERKKSMLSPAMLTSVLSNFHNEKWTLSAEVLTSLSSSSMETWIQAMKRKFTADRDERGIAQLVELIKGNPNTTKKIKDNLSKISTAINAIGHPKYVVSGKCVGQFGEADIKGWAKKIKDNIEKGKQSIEATRTEMVAVVERAIELKRKFKLRDTQKLTVLTLLTNDSSALAQVSTGEGKSLIVVAVSIMKVLCGEKVHIVTSSSVLARRDALGNSDIYQLFGVNVSHNCSEDVEKRKEAYSGNQVIYGDLSNFQRDYLLDRFYGKNVMGDCNFTNVIVDEVDSMLLDKGNNMLYLSHDIAGLDKLASVYIYIWQWINRPAIDVEDIIHAFDSKAIKEAVVNDLYGVLKEEDMGKLSPELSEQQRNTLWRHLIKAEILDYHGKMLMGQVQDIHLEKMLPTEFQCYKDLLQHLLRECFEREKFIHVPNYLRPFIEQHLEAWIQSAIVAFGLTAGEDYVVDVDKTGTSPDRSPNITILDRDTGTDQANSQWDEALHQFLQLKHGCKLSLQSLKAVFISNVSFFQLYSNLYGLTGTLGSRRERDLLQQIYKKLDFVTIPPAKPKQFCEDKPILCNDKNDWIEQIRNQMKRQTEAKHRSVLIICETVNDVETLHKAFGGKNAKHVHTYIREYEEFDIAQGSKELEQEQIIIATNLAGRGTDIKLAEGLRKAGGLHVCLTYLPGNVRIEQQAFGRAARSGDEGSGQLIFLGSKGQVYSSSKVLDLKKARDTDELHRISDIKAYYETQITIEECCFEKFKQQYERLARDLVDRNVPATIQEILLQSCLDKWAFWLDEHSKHVKSVTDEEDKKNLYNLLDQFIAPLNRLDTRQNAFNGWHDSTSWLAWVNGNPIQMIKLGKHLSQNRLYIDAPKNAILLFDDVIQKEPLFSEAARYYKAFALLKKINFEQKPLEAEDRNSLREFKQQLRKAARLLDEHSRVATNTAAIIGKIKKKNHESIIQIDAFEKQQESLANLYYMFAKSIDDILGHPVTPQTFVGSDIQEGLAKDLYRDLLSAGVLRKPRVKEDLSVDELKAIGSDYGVSAAKLRNFLSKQGEITERVFQKAIKEEMQLPSREAFWHLCIEREIFRDEIKYVVVDDAKLKEIDRSLWDHLNVSNEIEKQTLELEGEQIFLNAEYVPQQEDQKESRIIFRKNDFVTAIGRDRYNVLKDKGVLSFNRKATIDTARMGSVNFPHYDSITLDDFSKVNIAKEEGKKILAQLVKQKVIERQDGTENEAYRLKVTSAQIRQIRLPDCPVYENAVHGLLSVCFTYRIALETLAEQSEKKLFLIAKPHRSLVSELFEQRIIEFATVATGNDELKERLTDIYNGRAIHKEKLILMLSQSTIIPKDCREKLFQCLIAKGWISKCNEIEVLKDKGIRNYVKRGIENIIIDALEGLYYINDPDKRRKPLRFSSKTDIETGRIRLDNIDRSVENVLDNRLQLANKETIKNIVSIMKGSRSALKSVKTVDGKLAPLVELCGQGDFSNIEEVNIFALNGLDHLLQLEEKKWTREMLCNVAIMTAMGTSQIAVGAAIELYSAGIMTHVGAAVINEGVNDLFYAMGSLRSGHFCWEDYRQNKLENLVMSAITVGLGAYLSRGAKVSRYGKKLAAPGFEIGGKAVADMTGNQLIKNVGVKVVGKEISKRIALKTVQGLAFSLVNSEVDKLVENYLQGICEGIASSILFNIAEQVEKHSISASLQRVYDALGEQEAKQMVNRITQSAFSNSNFEDKFKFTANRIFNSVIQGVAEASRKINMTGGNFTFPILAVSKVAVWTERTEHIAAIFKLTIKVLDNLNMEINSNLDKRTKQGILNRKQPAQHDYERFKRELVDQWKLMLRERAARVISQHIVGPILKEGSSHLIRYVSKKMQKVYQSYKESDYLEHFDEINQKFKEDIRSNKKSGDRSVTEKQITEKYQNDLLKLMKKTRNPKLFAKIIRENVPMDVTCVGACTQVIHAILKEHSVRKTGLTIVVEGDGGMRQEFSSIGDETERIIIPLVLKDNHFEICGGTPSDSDRTSTSDNNCLYEALSGVIPGLEDKISADEFRAKVANYIEHDAGIRHHIQQGWHRLPISLGAYGGRSAKNNELVPTTNTLNKQMEDHSPYQHSFGGGWRFDGSKDVDLRIAGEVTNRDLNIQRANAFKEALIQINQKLSHINKKQAPLNPSNFTAIKHDTVLLTKWTGEIIVGLYPVEIESSVDVEIPGIRKVVQYKIKINFDNPIIERDLQGPHGPHIGYDIIRRDKDAPKGVTGHILINQVENKKLPDRAREYSNDDSGIPRIPASKLFCPPNRPNVILERTDVPIEGRPTQEETRGRSFPSHDF